MSFLYSDFDNPFAKKEINKVSLPASVSDNLKPAYGERPYQTEAFKRFIYLFEEDFSGKPGKPLHLLFNMATGSGKTLIMAGLILYLYRKGFRNFLFFVNSNNIIKKTKDNFLNQHASKYLFSDKVVIDGKEIYIKEAENFEDADKENINIKFTTIHQLHIDLNNTRENGITYEDFAGRKTVLIADEAHHLNSATKSSGNLFESWEGTVLEILRQNIENVLLEFTATLDYESLEISKKYQKKVIFKYDLAQFRADKYSKEINLIRSMYDEKERIVQALILNLYRSELAAKNGINLKPVILFKAKSTIEESQKNKANFHELIDLMSGELIEQIRKTSTIPVIQKAFKFFAQMKISDSGIAGRIKSNFRSENCISANDDREADKNQLLLNSLEDENNPIRAVFAVHKLNEGWDVLNLFDIVRLYEGRNSGGTNTTLGKTTLSEAQLIGRGARYFPFTVDEGEDKFTRKYDDDPANDLKILEELYYHARDESKYISELKKALILSGILDDDNRFEKKWIKLKLDFKQTDFYNNGRVIFNKRVAKNYQSIRSFADLGVSKRNFSFRLSSGSGKVSGAFSPEEDMPAEKNITAFVKLSAIPRHIVRFALTCNPYFYFDNLQKFFPHMLSVSDLLESDKFLGNMEITLTGTKARLENLTNDDYLCAVQGLLQEIETEIKSNLTDYEGSDYLKDDVRNVFKDKQVKVDKDIADEEPDGLVMNDPWYAYDTFYGTSEEKDFVEMFAGRFESIRQKFEDIYLIRNERELKIVDKLGNAFEPDFILFCKRKDAERLTYQVFIEPKGLFLFGQDNWKNIFLKEIRDEKKTLKIESDKYLITAVPFYNSAIQNEFIKEMKETLKL